MPGDVLRQWFIPGDGIDRNVISGDIQRYLGNDATVRPGQGSNEHAGVQGYWIKAFRNLTGPMIEDLKADSNRWRQEQHLNTNRGSSSPYYKPDASGKQVPDPYSEQYTRSDTYRRSNAGRPPRRETESPSGDSNPYGQMPTRMSQGDRMVIDTPAPPQVRPHPQDRSNYSVPNPGYPDNRGYANDPRNQYPMDTPTQAGYASRGQGSQPYQQDPRYIGNYPQPNEMNPAQGYQRGPNPAYPVPVVSSPYDSNPSMTAYRPESGQYGGGPYQQPQGQDPNRVYRQPDSYAPPEPPRYGTYPSPAATTVGPSNTREPVTSPPQQSPTYQASANTTYGAYNDRRGNQYRS